MNHEQLSPSFPIPEEHRYITIQCACCGHISSVPEYCGYRLCPVCTRPRNTRVRKRLSWLITNRPQVPGTMVKFVTFTVANQSDCAGMVKHLLSSFRRLRQRAWWKKRVVGGAFVIELTGSQGNWHAHIHAVVQARFLAFKELLALWKKCSGGQGVWIQNVKHMNKIASYLTKYLTKTADDKTDFITASLSLRGVRLFSPIGLWYNKNQEYIPECSVCPDCGSTGTYYHVDMYIHYERYPRLFCNSA